MQRHSSAKKRPRQALGGRDRPYIPIASSEGDVDSHNAKQEHNYGKRFTGEDVANKIPAAYVPQPNKRPARYDGHYITQKSPQLKPQLFQPKQLALHSNQTQMEVNPPLLSALHACNTPSTAQPAGTDGDAAVHFRFDQFIPQSASAAGSRTPSSATPGSGSCVATDDQQQQVLGQRTCSEFVNTPRKQLFPRESLSLSCGSRSETPATCRQRLNTQSDSDWAHELLPELSTAPSQLSSVTNLTAGEEVEGREGSEGREGEGRTGGIVGGGGHDLLVQPLVAAPPVVASAADCVVAQSAIAPTPTTPPRITQQPVAAQLPEDIQTQLAMIASGKPATGHERGLGIWKFDKKKKKRVYISLDGRILYGADAFAAASADRQLLSDQCMTPSQALRQLCASSPRTFQQVMASGQSMDSLAAWGVPASVVECYAERGVKKLFEWQVECLSASDGAALTGKNLVYSAPTSGGKTMVAEILMIRTLGFRGGIALFVVPYVSLAEEKTEYFQAIWKPLQLGVRSFHSEATIGGTALTSDLSLAICTIERANMLVNQLFAEKRLQDLSMVVIDEMHMVDDPHRGFLLEILLSKLRFAARHVQIIGLSATLPNLPTITEWLDATLFTTTFRPVQLIERLCIGRTLYQVSPEKQLVHDRTFGRPMQGSSQMVDVMVDLCLETLSSGGSILIFCPTKKACVSEAEILARYLGRCLDSNPLASQSSVAGQQGRIDAAARKRHEMLAKLADTSVGLCPVLAETVLQGIAYHHAGLTLEERKIVEDGYRQGHIKILATTSTLAAGVNLPARRVIIRKACQGNVPLDVRVFRQMCGRAGRFGLDHNGEAILMSTKGEQNFAVHLFTADLPPLRSALLDGSGGGVERIILEMICAGALDAEDDVRRFMTHTLFAEQTPAERVQAAATSALEFLLSNQFVQSTSHEDGSRRLSALQPGQACFHAGMSPFDAVEVLRSLSRAQRRLILSSDLHLVYLVTPPHPPFQPDWDNYLRTFSKLSNAERIVADAIGLVEMELVRATMTRSSSGLKGEEQTKYVRFYAALLLHQLVQEKPMKELTGAVSISRGQLQAFQKSAGSFCAQVRKFCEHLNWTLLEAVLAPFEQRLGFGVQEELLPLVRIGPEVPAFRARALYVAGYHSPAAIVAANQQAIHQVLVDSMPFSAELDITEGFKAEQQSNEKSARRGSNQNLIRHHIALCWKLTRVIRQKAIKLTEMESRLQLRPPIDQNPVVCA